MKNESCDNQIIQGLQNYVSTLLRRGPFPAESMLVWAVLLNSQKKLGIQGYMLEIGVEFGTSALLLADFLRANETLTLIDLKITGEVLAGLEKRGLRDSNRIRLIESSSLSIRTEDILGKCRWIHIDGGHEYHHVENDFKLVSPVLAEDGILVFDDVFEIRWPDITRAVMDIVMKNESLIPFLIANRKIYCCKPDFVNTYKENFTHIIGECNLSAGIKIWDDVKFGKHTVLVIKSEFKL